MSHLGISSAMGIPPAALTKLLNGEVTHHVGARLNILTMSVQSWINGEVRPGMAQALGTTVASAQQLRNSLDKKGAIGVVVGLCIDAPRGKDRPTRETAHAGAGETEAAASE